MKKISVSVSYRSITNASLDIAEARMENPRLIPSKRL